VLLAVFMGSILIVWAVELMDHARPARRWPPDRTAVSVIDLDADTVRRVAGCA